MIRTVDLCEKKYSFDLDLDTGQMIAARRHGESWPAGMEWRYSKAYVAALLRILELEDAVASCAPRPEDESRDANRYANRYHQLLGAKWMVEAIVEEMRTKFEQNANAQLFASHIEDKWKDEFYWRRRSDERGRGADDL
jgi:hypothetical protein